MKKGLNMHIKLMATFAALASLTGVAQATVVSGGSTSLTSLGTFGVGTYKVTASGIVGLAGTGGGFDTGPDGIPVTPVTSFGYDYCNPIGCSVDIPGNGNVGPGGVTVNFGTLMGTFNASPTSPSDYFIIGNSTNVTIAFASTLYALVNDTYYANDVGSYDVEVTPVPEAASWALMLAGFAAIGGAMRRRRNNIRDLA
jgi:hypothetical protein